MWLMLKKIVREDGKAFRYLKHDGNDDFYKGRENEAWYILSEMGIIEEKYKEVFDEDHKLK